MQKKLLALLKTLYSVNGRYCTNGKHSTIKTQRWPPRDRLSPLLTDPDELFTTCMVVATQTHPALAISSFVTQKGEVPGCVGSGVSVLNMQFDNPEWVTMLFVFVYRCKVFCTVRREWLHSRLVFCQEYW